MRDAVRLTNHFAPIVQATVSVHPDIVLHDGADLIAFLAQFGAPAASIGIEQTTAGYSACGALRPRERSLSPSLR
jgi:hypothetical protein